MYSTPLTLPLAVACGAEPTAEARRSPGASCGTSSGAARSPSVRGGPGIDGCCFWASSSLLGPK